jgi:tight adherence protein B
MSTFTLAMTALAGAAAGLGIWLAGATLTGHIALPFPGIGARPGMPRRDPRPVAVLLGVAAAAGALTRAPGLALMVLIVGYVLLAQQRSPSVPAVTSLGEAIATWTETVRDGLGAGRHLRAALAASCDQPPAELAEPLAHLSANLDTKAVPDALRALRREVTHPAIGPVIAVLDIAYRRGTGDLIRLMATQVDTTRDDVARLRDQHALRARHRRSMTLLLALFTAAVTGVLLVWPAFFAAYRTPAGQLVLTALGAVVAGAVHTLIRMGQPDLPPDVFAADPDPTP